jgi:hypothetical protein
MGRKEDPVSTKKPTTRRCEAKGGEEKERGERKRKGLVSQPVQSIVYN